MLGDAYATSSTVSQNGLQHSSHLHGRESVNGLRTMVQTKHFVQRYLTAMSASLADTPHVVAGLRNNLHSLGSGSESTGAIVRNARETIGRDNDSYLRFGVMLLWCGDDDSEETTAMYPSSLPQFKKEDQIARVVLRAKMRHQKSLLKEAEIVVENGSHLVDYLMSFTRLKKEYESISSLGDNLMNKCIFLLSIVPTEEDSKMLIKRIVDAACGSHKCDFKQSERYRDVEKWIPNTVQENQYESQVATTFHAVEKDSTSRNVQKKNLDINDYTYPTYPIKLAQGSAEHDLAVMCVVACMYRSEFLCQDGPHHHNNGASVTPKLSEGRWWKSAHHTLDCVYTSKDLQFEAHLPAENVRNTVGEKDVEDYVSKYQKNLSERKKNSTLRSGIQWAPIKRRNARTITTPPKNYFEQFHNLTFEQDSLLGCYAVVMKDASETLSSTLAAASAPSDAACAVPSASTFSTAGNSSESHFLPGSSTNVDVFNVGANPRCDEDDSPMWLRKAAAELNLDKQDRAARKLYMEYVIAINLFSSAYSSAKSSNRASFVDVDVSGMYAYPDRIVQQDSSSSSNPSAAASYPDVFLQAILLVDSPNIDSIEKARERIRKSLLDTLNAQKYINDAKPNYECLVNALRDFECGKNSDLLRPESQSGDNQKDVEERARRAAVWNDVLRELAISGDRLYNFLQTLAGIIHEDVTAIIKLDDPVIEGAQRALQNQRREVQRQSMIFQQRVLDALLSSIFRGSKIRMDIDRGSPEESAKGLSGQVVIVSEDSIERIKDLASGTSGTSFFEAQSQLESYLMQQQGQPMQLKSLVQQVREIIDNVTASNMTQTAMDTTDGQRAALQYLAEPKNSMVIRLKPETYSAIRRAYDMFVTEFKALQRSGRIHRLRDPPTAYECIEGRNRQLCDQFAELTGHVFAHSRIFSGSASVYVGQVPAQINMTALKLSLRKTVYRALESF